ncbi:hypothetical protein SF06_24650 [Pseudomonas flexibilis]|nr:hypothetical protein SF06_24650 [Pseudomonas flexibilis]
MGEIAEANRGWGDRGRHGFRWLLATRGWNWRLIYSAVMVRRTRTLSIR